MSGARRRFRFIKEIAEGGFGKVYLAEQLSADGFSRIVAAKLLHAKWSSHEEVVKRTRDEARLLGLIRHQHIVKVDDLTSIDGKCAIIMEYLEGVDLKTMTQFLRDRGRLFPRGALFEIMLAVASALDAAYNGRPLQGGDPLRVIHRDIKPSNIFLTIAGGVKVLDFGTARANFSEREAKTQALAFGSQGYMAPERMLGEEDTPAADIFSLGITLYELLTLEAFGRIPPRPQKFTRKIEERIATIPLEGDPAWVASVRDIVRAMTIYESGERPTAAQLVEMFENVAQGAPDEGLRKFCRTTAAEAKATEPELDTGDPLAGRVVEEDASNAFVGSLSAPATPLRTDSPLDVGGASPSAPFDLSRSGAAQIPIGASETLQFSEDDSAPVRRPSGGGGAAVKVAAAAAAALALVVGLVAVVVVVVVVALKQSDTLPSPSPTPVDEVEVAPEEPEPDSPAQGTGRVLVEDTREDVVRSTATTLSMTGGTGEVLITGGVGFKAEWDGVGSFDIGPLPEGSYRTLITTTSGSKIRNKTFDIVGGKACSVAFDMGAKEWTAACE
jgi:serine/threonine protein kinase